MKKFATILVLLFVLSVSAFAEGDIHTGGLADSQGQTCSTDNGGIIHSGGLTEDWVFENIFDFLKSIF
jgi:hypothetical protein